MRVNRVSRSAGAGVNLCSAFDVILNVSEITDEAQKELRPDLIPVPARKFLMASNVECE
jgi:hypothetical protein